MGRCSCAPEKQCLQSERKCLHSTGFPPTTTKEITVAIGLVHNQRPKRLRRRRRKCRRLEKNLKKCIQKAKQKKRCAKKKRSLHKCSDKSKQRPVCSGKEKRLKRCLQYFKRSRLVKSEQISYVQSNRMEARVYIVGNKG